MNAIICLLSRARGSITRAWMIDEAPIAYGPKDDILGGLKRHGDMFESWTNDALGLCLILIPKTDATCFWDYEAEFPHLNFRTIKQCPFSGLTID
jgi:hypothetical protein